MSLTAVWRVGWAVYMGSWTPCFILFFSFAGHNFPHQSIFWMIKFIEHLIYIYDLFIFIFCIYWRRISPLVLHSLMMAIRIIRRVCLWVPQIQEFILHGVPPAKANGFCGTRRHAEIYQTFCSCKLFSIKKTQGWVPVFRLSHTSWCPLDSYSKLVYKAH